MSLQQEEDLDTDRHRADGHVKTEAEIGVLLPQVRGCLELLETGRKDFLIEPSEGAWPC